MNGFYIINDDFLEGKLKQSIVFN